MNQCSVMCIGVALVGLFVFVFFFKQKTAYEIVSRDWSSDVCSSDLISLYITDSVRTIFYFQELYDDII